MWQTGKVTKWISGDRIRPLQVAKRIEDCKYIDQGRERWKVFCGMDFSHGDDLYAHGYLAVDYLPSNTMRGRFFFDCDAWVLEKTMMDSPNRPLYEEWIAGGWLKVCPGEVFDSIYSVNRLGELTEQSISDMVDQMIDVQVADGQFAETVLSFKDLEDIRAVFKQKLIEINHHRIIYPTIEENK